MIRIKVFSRSFDLRLYSLSKHLCESLGWECVRLTDQTADGYFYKMLDDTDCDVAVNVDEDCFLTNPISVKQLVDYVVENSYANAGCSDAGIGCPRSGNPIVTNPFFNVLNLQLIRQYYSPQKLREFDYQKYMIENVNAYRLVDYFGGQIQDNQFYNISREPYYPFFLWLGTHLKTLYLRSEKHADGVTTILYNPMGEPICMHTWFARFYTTPTFIVKHFQRNYGVKQKQRIDKIIDEAYALRQLPRPQFSTTDNCRFFFDRLLRWSIKVPQRIMGWPHKLKRHFFSSGNGGNTLQ